MIAEDCRYLGRKKLVDVGLGGGNFDPTNEHLASQHDLHKIPLYLSTRKSNLSCRSPEIKETSYRSVVIPFVVPNVNHGPQSGAG
jgi:hypothetical protein